MSLIWRPFQGAAPSSTKSGIRCSACPCGCASRAPGASTQARQRRLRSLKPLKPLGERGLNRGETIKHLGLHGWICQPPWFFWKETQKYGLESWYTHMNIMGQNELDMLWGFWSVDIFLYGQCMPMMNCIQCQWYNHVMSTNRLTMKESIKRGSNMVLKRRDIKAMGQQPKSGRYLLRGRD